ncbi:MAG TPA: HAD-IIB family hydrolase [Actinomycetota bacterium]|nr:HAD-IIB family hydrolase [Actinomycetota bacterium]
MRYVALASDYDGTLATDGRVTDDALEALKRLKATGRRAILVTGRILDDLLRVFDPEAFDAVVAENGALLYLPAEKERRALAKPPPEDFAAALDARGVPLSVGEAIVSTWEPNETHVLEVIRELGLELQVIFNKGAVMVLPTGVNKATGLLEALHELGLSPHNTVGVGDAENDHAFLSLCECSVAVANALPMLKQNADLVTDKDHGAGVIELIDRLLEDDLAALESTTRHDLPLGDVAGGDGEVRIRAYGESVLLSGPSESGKSTITGGFLERLGEAGYQFCLLDPEGDYETLEGVLIAGHKDQPPTVDEVMRLLKEPNQSVVVNLMGMPFDDRPDFFESLLPRLVEMRTKVALPHWLVIDEAHHHVPSGPGREPVLGPGDLGSCLLVTVHPDHLDRRILAAVDVIVTTGDPSPTLKGFTKAVGEQPPQEIPTPDQGEAVIWRRGGGPPQVFKIVPAKVERRRHLRKYAEGELPDDRSFYFRGPDGRLNLRAQNLSLFMQLANGVDDETWSHHLSRGDYSSWLRNGIKDEDLADQARKIEEDDSLSPKESREKLGALIAERYTLPA